MYITFFHVYMVLTKQTTEIQSLLVNKVCFHLSGLGVAAGSLETCTHVIPMPESHNLALVFACTMYTLIIILTCTNFNLVLVFPSLPYVYS